jgi:hypothetical protein
MSASCFCAEWEGYFERKDRRNMSRKRGEITAKIVDNLQFEGYNVFSDHGTTSEYAGKIVSTLEKDYSRKDELSQLDIAIVEQNSGKVVVLVEIEETSDRPKTILGDIFSVLLGEYICFNGKDLNIGDFTTLIVAGVYKTDHEERNQNILDLTNKAKASLGTQNARIGKIVIKTYQDAEEMSAWLPSLVERAVKP